MRTIPGKAVVDQQNVAVSTIGQPPPGCLSGEQVSKELVSGELVSGELVSGELVSGELVSGDSTGPVVLVIEDDPAIQQGVADALSFHGYQPHLVGQAEVGLELALTADYDLLVLDLVLPGADGLDLLEQVRQARPNVPIIILSARAAERDRVRGLRLGADDYVVKPFSVLELIARMEAVLRRCPDRPSTSRQLTLPHACVDLSRRQVQFADGTCRNLSAKEVELLDYLAGHRGRAVSREELLRNVWRLDPRGLSTRTIDMHVARLREKLHDPSDPKGETQAVILTIRGKGYMLAEAG